MNKLLSTLAVLLLLGCSPAPPPTVSTELPDTIIFHTQGYYNAAVLLEIAYDELPLCPTAKPICSDTSIKKKIRKIDEAAWTAIKEAKVAIDTPGFGESKLTTIIATATALTQAFRDITETLPKEQ